MRCGREVGGAVNESFSQEKHTANLEELSATQYAFVADPAELSAKEGKSGTPTSSEGALRCRIRSKMDRMPFFDGVTGQVHYRSWTTADADRSLIFLHGLGQNSGHYHRFARVLNGDGINVWALDHLGHGLSEGDFVSVDQIPDLAENAAHFSEIVQEADEGLPLSIMGHSLGSATTLAVLDGAADLYSCVVLCGTPKTMPAPRIASILNAADLPVLAVHGVDDRRAPVDAVREWIPMVSGAELREYENAGHDLLHEKVHRTVAETAADFIIDHTAATQTKVG